MSLKRTWLVIAAVALSLSACSAGASKDGVAPDSPTGTSPGASGGFVTANSTEPQNPLIPTNTNEVGGGKLVDLLFAGLVYYGADGSVHNDVAESIETKDAQTYTVKLKQGQTFSDHSPVTASSFVDAWNAGAAAGHLSAYFFEPIEGTNADGVLEPGRTEMSGLAVLDDHTFTITLKQPESDFPQRLGYSAFYPLPQSTLDDPETGGEAVVGNGPYKIRANGWVHDEYIELVPNQTYAGDRVAKNDGLKFIFYRTHTAAYADLLADRLDVLDTIPDQALSTFESALGDRAVNQPAAVFQSLTIPEHLDHFEGQEGALRRQAISLAINREEVTDVVFSGTRTPARDFTSPVVPGYDPHLKNAWVLDFNRTKARELWEQANEISPWEDTFTLAYNADGGHQAWVEAVSNQLANNLEIEVETEPFPDSKSLRDRVTTGEMESAFRTGWQADFPALSNFLGPLYATGAGSNDSGYTNLEFDSLLNQAAASSTAKEADKLLQEAQEILLEDLPAIPLWYSNVTGGYSESVSGVVFGWNSVPLYYDIVK